MSQYFPEQYEHSSRIVNVELNLSYYASEAGLRGTAGIDASMLASKADLASLEFIVND